MTGKRGDRVAPPAPSDQWEVRYIDTTAAKGWDRLCQQAPGNTFDAWLLMRTDPRPSSRSRRHHRLKDVLAYRLLKGEPLEQWQIEVTGGGRIWYLADVANKTCWITYAGTGHPKATDR